MEKNIIHRIKADKSSLRYAAICLFIVIAGVIYSITRMFDGAGSGVAEINVSDRSSADITAESTTESTTQDKSIYAYVCGAVVTPDVYRMSEGTRIFEAVEMAGGVTEGADLTAVNLADKIADGQKVYIPLEGEETTSAASSSGLGSAKININTATASELTALPGIGESRANDIVNYRNKNGFFSTIEDIKNVSGIKDAAFEKIKDYIKV